MRMRLLTHTHSSVLVPCTHLMLVRRHAPCAIMSLSLSLSSVLRLLHHVPTVGTYANLTLPLSTLLRLTHLTLIHLTAVSVLSAACHLRVIAVSSITATS